MYASETAPSSGIVGAAVNAALGSHLGGPIGAGITVGIAEGAKMASRAITKGNVDRLGRTVRARGGKVDTVSDQQSQGIRNWLTSIGIHADKIAESMVPE